MATIELKAEDTSAMAAEAATLAEAAHARRLTASTLAEATTGRMAVRRGQWIELTAEVLAHTRRMARRHLPYWEAEDMAADMLTAELAAGAEAGRPNCVRAERLTSTYLKLRAPDWRAERLAANEAELTEDMAEAMADLSDVAPVSAEEAAEADHTSAASLYRQAAEVARRLWLTADRPVIFALAQGLAEDGQTAAELARQWGIGLAVWKRDAAQGGREIMASYPDANELCRRLIDLPFTRRATSADGHTATVDIGAEQVEAEDGAMVWRRAEAEVTLRRRIGAAPPETGRHRTAAQLDREADVLLARPQMEGRKATASKASTGAPRLAAEVSAEVAEDMAEATWLAPLRRNLRRAMEVAEMPRRGARPHKAARGIPADGFTATAPSTPHKVAAPYRPRHGTAAEVLAHIAEMERYGASLDLLAAWSGAPIELAERPRLTVWTGTARRRPQEAAQAPVLASKRIGAPRTAAEVLAHLTAAEEVLQAEAMAQAPMWTRRQLRRIVPASRRATRAASVLAWIDGAEAATRGRMTPVSLDMATAAEHKAEADRPFSMVADMAAEEAEQN
jgi:hypothetical protein